MIQGGLRTQERSAEIVARCFPLPHPDTGAVQMWDQRVCTSVGSVSAFAVFSFV